MDLPANSVFSDAWLCKWVGDRIVPFSKRAAYCGFHEGIPGRAQPTSLPAKISKVSQSDRAAPAESCINRSPLLCFLKELFCR